eukprot:329716_1
MDHFINENEQLSISEITPLTPKTPFTPLTPKTPTIPDSPFMSIAKQKRIIKYSPTSKYAVNSSMLLVEEHCNDSDNLYYHNKYNYNPETISLSSNEFDSAPSLCNHHKYLPSTISIIEDDEGTLNEEEGHLKSYPVQSNINDDDPIHLYMNHALI